MTRPMSRMWVKVYRKIGLNRQLRRLPASTRWLYVILLTMTEDEGGRVAEDGEEYTVEEIALRASLEVEEAEAGLRELTDLGFIEKLKSGGYEVANFYDFQVSRDAHRKRIQRERWDKSRGQSQDNDRDNEEDTEEDNEQTKVQEVARMKNEECRMKNEEEEEDTPSGDGDELESLVPVMDFPLQGGRKWDLTDAKYGEYVDTFKGIDVLGELKRARQWVVDNPGKRKTKKGMTRYLNSWLGRAVDQAKAGKGSQRVDMNVGQAPEGDLGWNREDIEKYGDLAPERDPKWDSYIEACLDMGRGPYPRFKTWVEKGGGA